MKKFPYRLYTEPAYGELSPEVKFPGDYVLDPDDLAASRIRCSAELYCMIQETVRGCVCYGPMMRVRMSADFVRTQDGAVPFRIYAPPGEGGSRPVMLYAHGGSFMMNDLNVYDNVCRYLAWKGNLVVVAADYRLAPEFRFPAGLEDCYAVLKWIRGNAGALGADAERICVCGDSSGGNFAAVLAMMARDRKEFAVQKQVLIYPVTVMKPEEKTLSEIKYGTGHYLEYDSSQELFYPYYRDEADRDQPYLSPLYSRETQNLPEALFVMAGCDPLLDQGLMYAAKLEDSGNKVSVGIYEGMPHGFISFSYQKTFEALDSICTFVNG